MKLIYFVKWIPAYKFFGSLLDTARVLLRLLDLFCFLEMNPKHSSYYFGISIKKLKNKLIRGSIYAAIVMAT